MNLVELNLSTIPYGQPIPFALRGVGGGLLANKGFVIRSADDLRVLLARGQALYVDTDESGESYRAFLSQIQSLLLSNKPLNQIASMTLQTTTAPAAATQDNSPPAWREWQLGLTQLLRTPSVADFAQRFEDLFSALNAYLLKNPDGALLALMQMSAEETRYYSATHAMLSSVICMTVARETLRWPENRVLPLGRAALSMNVGMAQLQDELAQQSTPLTPQQAQQVDQHSDASVSILRAMGITDPLWLDAVRTHHHRAPGKLSEKTLAQQMARLIQRSDIFGARIAPRINREPMSVTSAMQASYYDETKSMDEAGAALVKALGIYPPGAWVKLASAEIGVVVRRGASAASPRVAVLLNKSGMPTGEPIPRDTAQAAWKIVSPVAHKEVRVRLPLEKLLAL
ncbi:HD-GYP domain-containing protein [Comamonas jiangduensis]|uniref:HD-GYP domain-containing protein n=1 Tax=Comamonas jiangduensis TaxID=1194168 RepID=UPI001C592FD6|nr:HD domain-containing phosphohydrolase [Comamonas jiangduensis]QXW18351.1 phosphohydrolase [Comamonas aquatica]